MLSLDEKIRFVGIINKSESNSWRIPEGCGTLVTGAI
jgi:hypothetical protein